MPTIKNVAIILKRFTTDFLVPSVPTDRFHITETLRNAMEAALGAKGVAF